MNRCFLLLVFIVFCVIIKSPSLGCPSLNITLDEILDGNPHLRELHEELRPVSIFSTKGLRKLIDRITERSSAMYNRENLVNHPEKDGENLFLHSRDDHLNEPNNMADIETHDYNNLSHSLHGHERHNYSMHDNEDHNHDINNGDMEAHDGHDHSIHGDHVDSENESIDHKQDHFNEKMVEPGFHNGLKLHEDLKIKREPNFQLKGNSGSIVESGSKNCEFLVDVIAATDFEKDDKVFDPQNFLYLCPSILNFLLNPLCKESMADTGDHHTAPSDAEHAHDHRNHHHIIVNEEMSNMTKDAWIAAIVSLIIIGLISLSCIMIIPGLKKSKYYVVINHFLLSLAVGSLAGDALIHLLSHAMTMEVDSNLNGHLIHGLYGFTAFLGIIVFLLMERLHNLLGNGHSHGGQNQEQQVSEDDDLVKKIGKMSAELNDNGGGRLAKMDQKLPHHIVHTSLIHQDSGSPKELQKGCFGSCPPLSPRMEDANGNNENSNADTIFFKSKSRPADQNAASVAECEKLVSLHSGEKTEKVRPKPLVIPISPAPLAQSSPPLSLVRQDSKNFNMVLQEYHVGHHGHSHHGHSHVTGKKDSLKTMILLGDGMHTFIDGMAIGAAFGTSLTGGIATAIAVMCHELPHKVGDFAILFEMGMKRRQAIKMVMVLWLLSFLGLILGVFIGSIKEVSPWIYCFTAGVFLYLALVDLLSELSINDSTVCSAGTQVVLQLAGMMTGAGIMLVIAVYEHDLQNLLEGIL